jgi:cleavage stimulation factor subunit 3
LTNISNASFLLNFAYIELLESKKDFEEIHAMFDKFLAFLAKDLESLESRIQNSNSSFSSIGTSSAPAVANNGSAAPIEMGLQSNGSSFATQSSEEKPSKSKELVERRTEYGLVWIMYMRFARRAEGLKSARAVFGKARRDKWTPWEVFEAAGTPWRYSFSPSTTSAHHLNP